MKHQSLKIGLLSALGISCLVGIGSLMNQEIQFYANEAIGENGVYTLTLQNNTSVVDGVVKTNLGNNVPLSISEGVTFNSDDSFATLPTSTKIYSASSGFQVIKSLQVFYQGSKLGYQLSKTSGDESNIVSFDSGTKVYMLNQYQHFTLKNIGTESSNITKIVVEYGCNGSLDGNMFNYTTGGSSYWDIATDEEGVTSITSNYDSTDSNLNLAAFMTLKGVRMGVGTVAYDIYFDSTQGKSGFGNLKGFATNVKSETTVYGEDYISSGVLLSPNKSETDGRVMTYGFKRTGDTKAAGWAHVNSSGGDANPVATFNGTSVKNNATTRIITQVENSLDYGKIVTNYIETAGGYSAKYVTNKDLSAFTGSCVGLQLQNKGLKVSNVVITSLDEVDSIVKADGTEVAVKPEGEGTQESPYLISSISNYLWFLEKAALSTSHFKLTSDLDLSNKSSYAMANSKNAETAFKGTFDGDGHKIIGISSLFITSSVSTYPSVFGYVTGGTIKNLTLDVKFESSVDKTAGFVSRLTGGTISNCTLNGLVYGIGTSSGVGGFVSYAGTGQTNINNCSNYATIRNSSVPADTATSHYTFAGGIVASNQGATVLISNCKNYGNVYAKDSFVGGIIGLYRAGTNNVITSCYNFGDISGIVASNAQVSGIAGNNRNTIASSLVFSDCLINNKLASTFTTLGTKTAQGYLVGRLDGTAAKLGEGNGLCDINGNAL